jgi:CheY-like chemotaxis protein
MSELSKSNTSNQLEQRTPYILVVDDMKINAMILANFLRSENYEVAVAKNGKHALEIIGERLPDLILLDIMMPVMDGFELSNILQTKPATQEIPIIFLSSESATQDIIKAFRLGARDYITKPYEKIELLARVETHLELKKSKEKLERLLKEQKDSQEKIIELEKKNSVLAMVVTTNHEINQPLTVLYGNMQLLSTSIEEQTLSDKQKKYLKQINDSIEKIKNILKKYRNSRNFRFEKYTGESNMIVFDKDKNNL